MAIKGCRRHQKRIAAPKSWSTLRKTTTFVTKIKAGAHSKELAMPLVMVIKDMMKLANTAREVKKIITDKQIFINGKVAKDDKMQVGFMDTVSILATKKHYRMLLNQFGQLNLKEIPEANSKFVLSKITGKKLLKKGKIQINFDDGRNQLIEKNIYKIGDTVKMQVPEQKILEHYEMKPGNTAYITKGKHAGMIGFIKKIIVGSREVKPQVELEVKGKKIKTLKDYIFVIGKENPVIVVGEAE